MFFLFSKVGKKPVLLYVWSFLWISYCFLEFIGSKPDKGRQFQRMTDDINMKCLDFHYSCLFFPFLEWKRVGLKWILKVKHWGQFSDEGGVLFIVFETLHCFVSILWRERQGWLDLTLWPSEMEALQIYLWRFQVRKSWGTCLLWKLVNLVISRMFSRSRVIFDAHYTMHH